MRAMTSLSVISLAQKVFFYFSPLFSLSGVEDLFKMMDLYLQREYMLYVGGKDADQQSMVFLQVTIGSIY